MSRGPSFIKPRLNHLRFHLLSSNNLLIAYVNEKGNCFFVFIPFYLIYTVNQVRGSGLYSTKKEINLYSNKQRNLLFFFYCQIQKKQHTPTQARADLLQQRLQSSSLSVITKVPALTLRKSQPMYK